MFKDGKGKSYLRTKAGKVWFHGLYMHVFMQQIYTKHLFCCSRHLEYISGQKTQLCPPHSTELIFWGKMYMELGRRAENNKHNK